MLESKNFSLRPLQAPADVNARYLGWLKDPDINRTLEVDGSSQTIETLTHYIHGHDNKSKFLFGIFSKSGVHIGTHSFRLQQENRLATVGVMIGDKSYWGKGVPLETRACLLDWAFDELECNKVEAGCFSNNLPAIYNFIKQHWTREGIQRSHRIVNGRAVDAILYGMLKEEWHAICRS